ncbi:2-isopropylmalate synthase [Mycena albidolilacea]|uniref:2-isopropylmalate synthase n=1 Tax=Mycena albidolilacea TaxID=1033008 RepID=A0AAD7EIB0_9AGAR|nr:2-isopropylmalate synthase [Mycena albidolilacea]
MPMLADPSTKYVPYREVPFPSGYARQWPNKRTTSAPRWLSTDLRDGNQALANPMSNTTKLELFKVLLQIGFKEIEVAYPSASDLEYQFVRSLIENNEVPDGVALQVITPARPDLIKKSVASLAGAKHAIIHLYNAVSPVFREVVFRNTKEQTIELTLNAVRLVRSLTEEETARSGTKFTLNYCLETFTQTEPEFAVELGNRVLEAWGKATPDDKVIFNLAATVECAPSNHYADQVEYFGTHINQRDSVLLSLHTHNDRGTAVGATELGLLAGGDRVEGCLLGNGERTGNVDLITLGLNIYSQGVSPNLDFSNLSEIVGVVCRVNDMTVPTRYPYAGSLVFSAFAGTHQDAIKKGLDAQERRWLSVERSGEGIKSWSMPYIPLDPKDLGYGYDDLIRVSSQSGKAGAAHVIKQNLKLEMPRRMQVSFYGVVQTLAEKLGKEMTVSLITETFKKTYIIGSKPLGRLHLQSYRLFPSTPDGYSSPMSDYSDDMMTFSGSSEDQAATPLRLEGQLSVDGSVRLIQGNGATPVLAIIDALHSSLGIDAVAGEFAAHAVGSSTCSCVEMHLSGESPSKSGVGSIWGVGISSDVATSKVRAVVSAVNTLVGSKQLPPTKKRYQRPPTLRSETWFKEFKLRAGHAPVTPTETEPRAVEASS